MEDLEIAKQVAQRLKGTPVSLAGVNQMNTNMYIDGEWKVVTTLNTSTFAHVRREWKITVKLYLDEHVIRFLARQKNALCRPHNVFIDKNKELAYFWNPIMGLVSYSIWPYSLNVRNGSFGTKGTVFESIAEVEFLASDYRTY